MKLRFTYSGAAAGPTIKLRIYVLWGSSWGIKLRINVICSSSWAIKQRIYVMWGSSCAIKQRMVPWAAPISRGPWGTPFRHFWSPSGGLWGNPGPLWGRSLR